MNDIFTKTFVANSRYLHMPVKNGNEKVVFQLLLDGQMVREFDVELALDDQPDWWAFYDIRMFAGQTLELSAVSGAIPAPERLAETIRQGDQPLGMDELYREKLRPQFHFTSRRGWNNDPNGMVHYQGEWHLFYQHNPFGVNWGNMHWGHAVSRDLVHWEELPEALYQRSLKDMAFSGGGLVDEGNTAGFVSGPDDPLVVAFTSTGRGECLAYSADQGRTLVEYAGNPVLAHGSGSRDPKIIRYGDKWVLIVYEESGEGAEFKRGYAIYKSANLKDWTPTDFLPDFFECPELFELPVDGDPARKRWVIYGCLWEQSRSACVIGSFDGRKFSVEESNTISHYGPCFYAAQNFSNAPGGRQIMIGWLAGAQYPGMPFSQGMTVPLELSLRSTPDGTRLCYTPVRELESLREETVNGEHLTVESANALLVQSDAELLDVELTLRIESPDPLVLDVRGYPIRYEPASATVTFAGVEAKLSAAGPLLRLRVLVDRSVTEVFAQDGLAAFAAMTIFEEGQRPLRIEGQAVVESLTVHNLKSIWG